MQKIITNKIKCKLCGDIIESKHHYDFKSCSCGACSVDGGHDYTEYFMHCPADTNYVSGDYRSEYCQKLFQEADIVVTNPPFSLFRDFVATLEKYKLKYVIIGNMNAITYKEIFPMIKNDKLWTGFKSFSGGMDFVQPAYSFDKEKTKSYKINEKGKIIKKIMCIWFTNIDIQKQHENLILTQKYTPDKYPHYYNYDAIEVSKVKDIPDDYDGIMGVPITFLDKYNPDQFEIIGLGIANLGLACGVKPYDAVHKKYRKEVQKRGAVDGDLYMVDENNHPVVPYARILIKRKVINNDNR